MFLLGFLQVNNAQLRNFESLCAAGPQMGKWNWTHTWENVFHLVLVSFSAIVHISNWRILLHPLEKAEALTTFTPTYQVLITIKLTWTWSWPTCSYYWNILITEQDVLYQLSNLNVNKPHGPDGVTPKLLKQLSYSICKPLHWSNFLTNH